MNNDEIIGLVKQQLKRQNKDWRFIYGMTSYSAKELSKALDTNPELRKMVVTQLHTLCADLFARGKAKVHASNQC